jgi:ubiquinone biosynthesis protein UbiJ
MAFTPFSWIGPIALPRLTLLLNHVVSSEPLAAAKLQPHSGRQIEIRWESAFAPSMPLPGFLSYLSSPEAWTPPPMRLLITPAGLFELASESPGFEINGETGLTLTVKLPSPLTLARLAAKGDHPEVNIEGDAKLAEVASWLMSNLRWDIQDDVARLLGNTPAEMLRHAGQSVRQALQRWRPGQTAGSTTR